MYNIDLATKVANNIRTLSADAIQKAKSGHPGMPLGCADFATALFARHLRFNPKNPEWIGRDRFILSAGHGSMLLYSLLYLFDCGLTLDDIKDFRQLNSLTPGHPEFGHTAGVDITTGPLGSGFSSAVGMAIAAKNFAAQTGLNNSDIPENRMFVICGDGCIMEGSTQESASLAGHLKLDNIIVFYDSNDITIEGGTNLAFSEDVKGRFEALNWRVLTCDNANDIAQCDAILTEAKNSDGRPTLIIGKTSIGYGAPNKQGKSSAHGEPLGEAEVAALKVALNMPSESFCVVPEVAEFCKDCADKLVADAAVWDGKFQSYLEANPDKVELINALINRTIPENIEAEILKVLPLDKAMATRASSGLALQKVAELVPALIGGAADLAPSTKTEIKSSSAFTAENRAGRNIHFGVRELGMALAGNGLALYGNSIPFTSTFFVFSDYMKPAIRLAAIQKLHQIYIFTHDSFFVGEDGPTHEPVEQLAMLRAIPGLTVIRPGDTHEVAGAWGAALKAEGPVAMLLTRQDLKPFDSEMAKNIDVSRGAYVLDDEDNFDLIMIATGSEVNLALESAKILRNLKIKVRVVSMPSQELFLAQDLEYQDSVLPPCALCRVSIEAGSSFGWHRIVDSEGLTISLDNFGASAPASVLAEEFGFTPESVVERVLEHFTCDDEDDDCGCGCEHDHDHDCGCGDDCGCN